MKRFYLTAGVGFIFSLWAFIASFESSSPLTLYKWANHDYLRSPIDDPEFKNNAYKLFPDKPFPHLEPTHQRIRIAFERLKDYRPCLEIHWNGLNYITENELAFASPYIDSILPPPFMATRDDALRYTQKYILQNSALLEEINKRAAHIRKMEQDLKKHLAEQIAHNKTEATETLVQWFHLKSWQAMVLPVGLLLEQRIAFIQNNQKFIEDFLALGCFFDLKKGFAPPEDRQDAWIDLKPVDSYFHGRPVIGHYDWIKATRMGLPPDTLISIKKHYCHRLPAKKYKLLQEKMTAYNELPKTDPAKFPDRAALLLSLVKCIKNLEESKNIPPQDAKTLNQIRKTASGKALYLRLLLQKKEDMDRYEREEIQPRSKPPLVRVTELDALENLDPAHRLTFLHRHYFYLWKRLHGKAQSFFDYFAWLEGIHAPDMASRDIDQLFTKEEKRVYFRNGRAYNQLFPKQPKAPVMDGLYLYVLDEEERLYIFPDENSSGALQDMVKKRLPFPIKGRIYHHDVITGQPLALCAGKIEFYGGKIKKIDNYSGHFSPDFDTHLKNAVKILARHNAFHETALVGDFEGNFRALAPFLSEPPNQ